MTFHSIDRTHQSGLQLVVVLLQGVLLIVHDQRFERLVDVEGSRKSVPTLRPVDDTVVCDASVGYGQCVR